MRNNRTKINLMRVAILILSIMAILTWYANNPTNIRILGHTLKKSEELNLHTDKQYKIVNDTLAITPPLQEKKSTYGTKRRFLIMGDSQVEGLKNQLYDYCKKNGHELLCAVTWYSATDMSYAEQDTIAKIISKFQPDYIVFAIGLNQLYQVNMQVSELAVQKLLHLFDTIPYCWIGPANFIVDKGINQLYQRLIPADRFFLSKDLILERQKDRRHPSWNGYQVWMDTVGRWLETRSKWQIEMKKPDSAIKKRIIKDIIFSGELK